MLARARGEDRRRLLPRDRARSSRPLVAGVLTCAVVLLGACSSSSSTGSSATTDANTETRESVDPAAGALLTRLAVEGSDAVFTERFGGTLDAGGEAGPLVFAGRAGDQAVVYVCDGTTGTWFTGTVGGDGGTLQPTTGDATVTVTPADGGWRTTFDGGSFGGRSATAARLEEPGDGRLV